MARKPSNKPSKTIRCAIYTRKSTDEGLDSDFNSLDAQREAAEAYIASQKGEGWACLPERYDDGGFSGGNMERPALKRLLADVGAGLVDAIVVYKVDRLSRSLLDFSRIIGALDSHGVSFVSVTQQFNTSTSMGRLTLNVLLSFAQFEREIIAERTRDKMSAARRKGKWCGGMPVLGYDVAPDGGRLVINGDEAERVRGIFDLYLERESLITTARTLNGRGWTTKRWTTRKGHERGGKQFTKTTLSHLLTNIIYTGKVRYHGTVYDGEHDAIVDDGTWQDVQALLRRNGRNGGSISRNRYGALLRGLLRCGPCETAMVHTYTRKGATRYRYYVCTTAQKQGWDTCLTKSVPAPEIERFVVDRIRAIGTDERLVAETVKQARKLVDGQVAELRRQKYEAEKELKGHQAEANRIVGRKCDSSAARLAELHEQVSQVEERLATVQRDIAIADQQRVDAVDLRAALARFDPVWDALAPRERARVVHLLVEQVEYDGESESVTVTFRPTGIRTLAQEET